MLKDLNFDLGWLKAVQVSSSSRSTNKLGCIHEQRGLSTLTGTEVSYRRNQSQLKRIHPAVL